MGKIAFLFAGQGAQTPGMGRDLYEADPAARAVFDMDGAARDMCFYGSREELDDTENAQPCLFLTGLACAMALRARGVTAGGAAGFSLGELTAVAFAGLLPPGRALEIVRERARLMRRCVDRNPGAMYALLRLDEREAGEVCAEAGRAWCANYNCPGQTVAAVADGAEDALTAGTARRGGRAVRLAVGGAFHSPLMADAASGLERLLENEPFSPPEIPVWANATAERYGDAKSLLPRQASSPVLWRMTIENMVKDGFDTFIECGPGGVLSGLVRRIAPGARAMPSGDLASLEKIVSEVAGC